VQVQHRRARLARVGVSLSAAVMLALAGCGVSSDRSAARDEAGRDNVRGQPTAPVTIEEWGDYQCPACGAFARLQPELDAAVLANGSARFIFRNLAFLGPESVWAAEAAECAGDQGRYWDYHDTLYALQRGENRGAFTKDRLKQFAANLNLEQGAFNACLDTDMHASRVRQETERGKKLGVNSTPTLFVNGQRVILSGTRSAIEVLRVAVQYARTH
jgi:protein-disulfide isomerase